MNNIINEFNNISMDFLQQTSSLVGSKYLYKFQLIIKFNSMFAIDMFIKNVLPFKFNILNRNEEFFLNKSDNDYMDDIIGIKQIYHTLDEESKNNIWDIMTALIYLSEKRYLFTNSFNQNNNTY